MVVSWGEGRVGIDGNGSICLLHDSCTVSLFGDPLSEEWCKWVDRHSPHCRLVWRSQFPGLLIKCLWYALDTASFEANVRSLMFALVQKTLLLDGGRGS